MDCSDVIALIAIGVSVINLLLLVFFSRWQNTTSESALETQIRTDMNAIVFELNKIAQQKAEGCESDDLIVRSFFSITESYRNAYEDLCQKYVTRKINKKWVERMYKEEIKNLVENEEHKEFYATTQSKYVYTLEVYKNWFKQTR